jgi:hypothetical protein
LGAAGACAQIAAARLTPSEDQAPIVSHKETNVMKFVLLKSRGGDYLVVAQNVAWLRSHENGQTKVGMIGSEAIQVSGSIEEVAGALAG